MKYDDEYDDDDTGPGGPFHPAVLFIMALAAGTVLIAGILFAHDIFTRFIPLL